jgi:hypothetical protein
MLELFYVSFLVVVTYVGPPLGWMQFDQPFMSKVECEAYIDNNWNNLQEALQERLTYQEIKTLQCMTSKQVHELNIQLGTSAHPE